jgi:hypothetical protein
MLLISLPSIPPFQPLYSLWRTVVEWKAVQEKGAAGPEPGST